MRSVVKAEGRRRMKKFKIKELSSVNRPAQEGAQALIMKRDGGESAIAKSGEVISMVTTVEDDHAHVLRMWVEDGDLSIGYAGSDSEHEHSHGAVNDGVGNITIVMNAGHTHEVSREDMAAALMAMISKQDLSEGTLGKIQKSFPETINQEDIPMSDEEVKKTERLEAIVGLSAPHRAHFDTIEKAEDQDAFLTKSDDERQLLVPKVEKTEAEPEVQKNEDPNVIYTSQDGTVFTKDDDIRLVTVTIEKDSKDAEIAALKLEKSDREFEKRAELELANLPGTVSQRGELLKSVESIENPEHRAAALKALTAGNAASEDVTKSLGTAEGAKVEKTASVQAAFQKSEPELKLDDLAKGEAIKLGLDPVKDFAKAYSIVVSSDEGKELYNQHRNAMINRIA